MYLTCNHKVIKNLLELDFTFVFTLDSDNINGKYNIQPLYDEDNVDLGRNRISENEIIG